MAGAARLIRAMRCPRVRLALTPFASAAVLYANAIVRIPSPRDMGSSAGTTTQRTCDRRCRRSESPSKSSA